MKKFWKALGIAALAAAVPVRYKKDEETGVKTFQSLLWKMDITPKEDDTKEIGIDLMEGVITAPLMNLIDAKKEAELFTDDPEEAVLFADEILAGDEAQIADDKVQTDDGEAQDADDEVQDAADEAQDAAGEGDDDSDFS